MYMHDTATEEDPLRLFCYVQKDGDVVISLSASPKDSLLVRSADLARISKWFERSLAPEWIHNKTTGNRLREDGSVLEMKRFELAYEGENLDISATLEGRIRETPFEDRRQLSAKTFSQEQSDCTNHCQELQVQSVVDSYWESNLIDDVEDALYMARESAFVAAHKIGLCLMLELPLHPHLLGRKTVTGYTTSVLLRVVEFVNYCCEWKDVSRSLAKFILRDENRYELREHPTVYMRLACLLRSEELFKLSMREFGHTDSSITKDLGNNSDLLNRVGAYRMWHSGQFSVLASQLCVLRCTDHPLSTSGMATGIYRNWLTFQIGRTGVNDVVMMFASRPSPYHPMTRQVTDIYTQWMKRTRRDQPLPPYVSEATLMQRLNSIYEAAQRLVTEAFVDPNAL